MSNTTLKSIIEGFIFASDKPISIDRIISLFPENEAPEKEEIQNSIDELIKDYELRGIELHKVSTGFRFQVRQELTPWVSRLWEEKPARYTRALLETLALIVYRQPITRGEIEEIRGVAVSSNIIKTLQERDWVKVVGHRDVPGKPALYASTRDFLDYFNLESLDQLPPLSDIKDLDTIITELDPDKNADLIEAINEMKETEASEESSAEVVVDNESEITTSSDAKESEAKEQEIDPIDAAVAEILASEEVDAAEDTMDDEVEEQFETLNEIDEANEEDFSESEESAEKVESNEIAARKESQPEEKVVKPHSSDSEYETDNSDYEDGDSLIADEETSNS